MVRRCDGQLWDMLQTGDDLDLHNHVCSPGRALYESICALLLLDLSQCPLVSRALLSPLD